MTDDVIMLRGTRVTADEYGNVCLNDLWALAGEPANKRARDWFASKRVVAVKEILDKRIAENSLNSFGPDAVPPPTHQVIGKGRPARTYAHAVLALDYAAYLDPRFAIEVNEVFLRYKAKDLTLALEILEGISEQTEYDSTRVHLRTLLKEHNKLSARAAKVAEVKDFAAYNGAGLSGLYGGKTKAEVLRHKKLPSDAHHLDHANHEELAANYFKATQAEAKLKRDGIKGQAAANEAHRQVGISVRETIKGLGGTMPEDEPALDNIKEAEKRLKTASPAVLPKKSD